MRQETHREMGSGNRRALIAGATGAIGSALLKWLNESDQYTEVHCIGRRAPKISGPKIKAHLLNFDELESFDLEQPIDDVFCALGTTIKTAGSVENFRKVDVHYVHQAGKLAQRLDAKTFSLVSATGANARSFQFYNKAKGEAEQLLQDLGLKSLRIFRPSLLHGERDEFRLKEEVGFVALKVVTPLLQGPWRKYRAIAVEQVAKAMYLSAQKDYPSVQIFESDAVQRF